MIPRFLRPFSSDAVHAVLDRLYANTLAGDGEVRASAVAAGIMDDSHPDFYHAMRRASMPVTPDFGLLLHMVVRLARPQLVVEFGTSFGVSTVFIAAALRANGQGRIITTEFETSKASAAAANIADAGLGDLVEIRSGDARQTLADLPAVPVSLLFLDGAKSLYLDVLRCVEPALGADSLIISDNSEMAGGAAYRDHIRNPDNGYAGCSFLTSALGSNHAHEMIMRRG
jgi:predicted O-methyltransferase YrrM